MGPGGGARLTGALMGALTQDVGALLREELRAAQADLTGKARRAGRGGALLAGAGVLGALATASSAVLLQRVLDGFLPPRTAAAVTTVLYAGGAAALGAAGAAELRRALPQEPPETVTGLPVDISSTRPASRSGQSTRRRGIIWQLRACFEPHDRHGRDGLAAEPSSPKQPHAGSRQSA